MKVKAEDVFAWLFFSAVGGVLLLWGAIATTELWSMVDDFHAEDREHLAECVNAGNPIEKCQEWTR